MEEVPGCQDLQRAVPLLKTFSDHSFLVSVRPERAVISSNGMTEVPASETRRGGGGVGVESRVRAAAPVERGLPWPAPQGPRNRAVMVGTKTIPPQRLTCSPQNLTRPRAQQTPQVSNAWGNRLIRKEEVNEFSLGYTLTLRAGPSLYVIKNDSLYQEGSMVLGKFLLLRV